MQKSKAFFGANNAEDYNGHGTAVAGLIAAKDNSKGIVGVTPGATIIALKACDLYGMCSIGDVTAAVDYASGNFSSGDVVNISLGFVVKPYNSIAINDLETSIIAGANAGLKFTISAGNDKKSANLKSPARVNHINVFTMSAYDIFDDFWSHSNFGNPPIDYGGPVCI